MISKNTFLTDVTNMVSMAVGLDVSCMNTDNADYGHATNTVNVGVAGTSFQNGDEFYNAMIEIVCCGSYPNRLNKVLELKTLIIDHIDADANVIYDRNRVAMTIDRAINNATIGTLVIPIGVC